MKFFRVMMSLYLVLFLQQVMAAEPGVAIKSDAIKKEPYSDSKTVATLGVGDKVNIFKKDGGWLNVRSAKGNGWVRMLSIRKGEAKADKSLADSFKGLASGRSGTGKVVATTGIRGLNEEELKSAKFDAVELGLVESYASSRAEAQSFATQGKLKSRSLDYLPVPK